MLKTSLKTSTQIILKTVFDSEIANVLGGFLLWEDGSSLLWEAGSEILWKK